MNKKYLYIIFGITLVSGIIFVVLTWPKSQRDVEKPQAREAGLLFSPEVEEVLGNKKRLIVDLLANPVIIEAVRKSNGNHASITQEEILQLDQRWRSSEGIDDFIEPYLTNNTAAKLIEFQKTNRGFSEIFVTDEHGLNVGQTNKTTDYYQADEDWWVSGYDSGKGRLLHGPIEFDESAQTVAISIYVPVMDPETNKAIGVAKAVLDIAVIKSEL